jgi:hypothetical protein
MENILTRAIGNHGNGNMKRMLLLSGFLSSVIYVATDLVASLSYPGYSITGQNYSELLATGSPTRPWMLISAVLYNFLVACFAIAIWKTSQPSYKARVTGVIILGYAILSMVTPLFFQMDMRGAEPTPNGSLHPLMTAVMSLFIMLSMGSGAFLSGKRFMIYSFATIIIVIVFGLMTVNQVPDLEAGLDTPWMGLKERVNIYLTMLWFAVLSLYLFQQERGGEYQIYTNIKSK